MKIIEVRGVVNATSGSEVSLLKQGMTLSLDSQLDFSKDPNAYLTLEVDGIHWAIDGQEVGSTEISLQETYRLAESPPDFLGDSGLVSLEGLETMTDSSLEQNTLDLLDGLQLDSGDSIWDFVNLEEVDGNGLVAVEQMDTASSSEETSIVVISETTEFSFVQDLLDAGQNSVDES